MKTPIRGRCGTPWEARWSGNRVGLQAREVEVVRGLRGGLCGGDGVGGPP